MTDLICASRVRKVPEIPPPGVTLGFPAIQALQHLFSCTGIVKVPERRLQPRVVTLIYPCEQTVRGIHKESMFVPSIHFVQRHLGTQWPELWKTAEPDIDQHPGRVSDGETSWILQTYLRIENALRELGLRVTISDSFSLGSINIAHRDSLNRWLGPYLKNYIVCVRADRPQSTVCNWEIAQNGLTGTAHGKSFVPSWPQPGLLKRKRERGHTMSRAAYFGRLGTTSPWLTSPAFTDSLNRMGIQLRLEQAEWHDYREVDLVIAHRQEAPCMLLHKPASKLINAWLAGVPALLSDEPAFRELRRTELDYFIVNSEQDAIRAVTALRSQPRLYDAMVTNGLKRAEEFNTDATRRTWVRTLQDDIVPDAERFFSARDKAANNLVHQIRLLLRQRMDSLRFRETYRVQMENIQRGRAAAGGAAVP
jgi:hypothetical protein